MRQTILHKHRVYLPWVWNLFQPSRRVQADGHSDTRKLSSPIETSVNSSPITQIWITFQQQLLHDDFVPPQGILRHCFNGMVCTAFL
jgi:hypothetical protein